VPTASFYVTSQDIEYGEAGRQKLLLDAHVPGGDEKFPVAIIVHGGGWSTGDKETDIVPVLAPFMTNFTWFTINYRLAPTNRWPACFDDVQTAIRWVKQHAPEYKGDPSHIALIGYSAGGHLVCFAATQAMPDTRVQAIVGLAPPTDITADAQRRGSLDKWSSMENLLGRNSLDDETLRIMRQISPSEHISANLPPFLLVQGSADTSVPYPLTQRFAAKLQAANVPCDFITITNATHTIADWSKFDPQWQNKVVTWLNDKLTAK
jgi:acetyl esterase/lipase